MEFIINPYSSVGKIRLNETKEQLYSAIGKPTESFLRNTFSKRLTDNYLKFGFFIDYDSNEKIEAIEIYPTDNIIIFEGMNLFDINYQSILNEFKKKDVNIEEDETGFTSLLFGIGIYCPNKIEDINSPIEGVIVFRKNYYD